MAFSESFQSFGIYWGLSLLTSIGQFRLIVHVYLNLYLVTNFHYVKFVKFFFQIFYIFTEFCFLLLLANEIHMLRSPYNNLVQLRSIAQLCLTLCDSMDCSTPGFPVLHHFPELFKVMSIDSVMPSNHLILCHTLLLLPSVFPSIRVFSNESTLPTR